jgi:hypothetical protein
LRRQEFRRRIVEGAGFLSSEKQGECASLPNEVHF